MYRWRDMTPDQREATLASRKLQSRPKHSPGHHFSEPGVYLITGTCYEHKRWIGISDRRMDEFTNDLLKVVSADVSKIDAWAVLPNHYHVLVVVGRGSDLLKNLGRLHGRTSHDWNGEEGTRGQQVWFNCIDRTIGNDGHHMAAINYLHHNPVKHGYVAKWDQWQWSSAAEYIERLGREEARRRWIEYPLLNFGKGWDD